MAHEPITVDQLINILKKKNKGKEVIVNVGFNDFDIATVEEKKDEVTIYLKQVAHRDSEDSNSAI